MSLLDHIMRRIATQGPMRIDEYMTTCLLHPTYGYYTTQTPFGRQGDFTTAPEISQMFGELVGLALVQCWLDQGAPDPFILAELGPGRGTLMADALRACAKVPGFVAAAQVTFVEASPALQDIQSQTIAPHSAQWRDGLEGLPTRPLFLIANEFFDALPIRQFIRQGDQWRERQVGLDGDKLIFGLGPAQPQPMMQDRRQDTEEGGMVEVNASAGPLMVAISQHISAHGGAALIIDYGEWRTKGDSLQAVKSHQRADPLETPGLADLTAHVDFEALALAAAPCSHSELTPQGVFLERLGITSRAQSLARGLSGEALQNHIAAHQRLTHPEEMGNLFKVLGLFPPGCAPPPGLEACAPQ